MRPLLLTFLSLPALAAALRGAVVQHAVYYSPDGNDAATVKGNLDLYLNATILAAKQGADIVVFPEFGIGMPADSCVSPSQVWPYCEPIPFSIGQSPCASNGAIDTPIQYAASCMASQFGLYVAINTCESSAEGNYNSELVFEAKTGNLVASYRKEHPWYNKCFLTPSQPDLTTFSLGSLQVGLMTCFDIIFPSPGPALVDKGVKTFVYSASIPMIGAGVQSLWSAAHNATLLGSNLAMGMSGVFRNGTRLTAVPPSAGEMVLVAEV